MPAIASPVDGAAARESREWPPIARVWPAVVVGALLRVALALVSLGSNDVRIWQKFGRDATRDGFAELWRTHPFMNHPPLPVAWAEVAYRFAGESTYVYSLILKLPSVVADCWAIAIVGRIVGSRAGGRAGAVAALLMAINPASLLITAYHGNTDSILGLFTLIAWWQLDRGRPALAALALAASLNVKLGPVPSIVPFLACARSRGELARMLAALAIGALPFLAMWSSVGTPFVTNLAGYRSPAFSWLADVAWFGRSLPAVGPIGLFLSFTHYATVPQVTLLIAATCAIARQRRPDRYDALTLGALYWSAFMFWNANGLQYCVWPLSLFAALRPRLSIAFGVGAGVLLVWAYLAARVPGWPLESSFAADDEEVWLRALPLPLLSLLAILLSVVRGRLSARPATGPR